MSSKFLIIIFVLVFSLDAFGQTSSKNRLSLSVTVTDLEITRSSSRVEIKSKLHLRFQNDGRNSIILLNKAPEPLTRPQQMGMELRKATSNDGSLLAGDHFADSNSHSDVWAEFRKLIDVEVPPLSNFVILAPKESLTIEDSLDTYLDIVKGSSFPERETWENVQKLSKVQLFVFYQIWANGLEGNQRKAPKRPKFAETLRKRWIKYGYLWTDNIISKPIFIDLSSAIIKNTEN